ncbi:MAG: FecR domain-containing protein [Spirochaetes bacterium]|nr:FecR domain-containing protein [Spirochaetota bacterium]
MNKLLYSVLCLILITPFGCIKEAEDDYSTIIFFIGDVKKNNKEIGIGDIILQNDIIATGAQSSCDIKIGGSIIRVKEKSNVKMAELYRKDDIERTSVDLDVGKLLCKAKKLSKSENFLVKTPTAVAGVRGTKFTVEADTQKTSRIKVFNGNVTVVKRVKQLDEAVIGKIMETAPSLASEEKVIITEKEVKHTEKIVEQAIEKEQKINKDIDAATLKVISETNREDVLVANKEIQKFKIEDFAEENNEMITVKEKPKEVIAEIKKVVILEKKQPVPEGRLLITRYEIYFIKNEKPLWEGKIINPPIQKDNKIYIASGDYVFCASIDGPVLWKRNIKNDGKVEVIGDKLLVFSEGKAKKLDLITGL